MDQRNQDISGRADASPEVVNAVAEDVVLGWDSGRRAVRFVMREEAVKETLGICLMLRCRGSFGVFEGGQGIAPKAVSVQVIGEGAVERLGCEVRAAEPEGKIGEEGGDNRRVIFEPDILECNVYFHTSALLCVFKEVQRVLGAVVQMAHDVVEHQAKRQTHFDGI